MCKNVDSSPDHIRALVARLGDPDLRIVEEASRELLVYGVDAVPTLLTALGEAETWFGAAETLGSLGELSVEPLIAGLDNPRLANFVVHALRRMGSPAVVPLVHALPQAQTEAREWILLLLEWFSNSSESLNPELQAVAVSALAESK